MSDTFSNLVTGNQEISPLATLNVELVGDLICPFCYLGKRRLDQAVRYVEGPYALGWYPFQLNPEMPSEGENFEDYLASRFGSKAAIQPVLDRLKAEGSDVGIDYQFDKLKHVPNTLPAHQVMYLATNRGIEPMPLVEDFMASYLTRAEDIGDTDVLVNLAERHGIPADDVVAIIQDDAARKTVLAMEEHVRESGINGVPGFLMNRRLLLIGVQEISGIVAGFDRAMFGDSDGKPVEAALH